MIAGLIFYGPKYSNETWVERIGKTYNHGAVFSIDNPFPD